MSLTDSITDDRESRPIRVLVVDDEAPFRETLCKVLSRRGMEVIAAATGQEGLEKLAAQAVDVVVLDLRMPGMDGLTTLRMINDLHPRARVIILTGHGTTDAGLEALRNRAFDFLLKPAATEQLVEVIVSAALTAREAQDDQSGPKS
ncbi:MAG: response regulator [Acidobacteriota bacterium]